MYLDEFYDYKNQLMDDLLTNDTILKLLSDDGISTVNPEDLMYKQVFPYEYVPETIEHGQTYICCDVDVTATRNSTFISPTLYVWIFTHKSKLRLPQGGVRVDRLASEIDKELNGSRYYVLGELNLDSARRFAPTLDYQGKVLVYSGKEFNRVNPTGKTIPANRKRGQ